MAEVNRSICFTWGQYFPGREKKGMEAFEQAVEFFQNKLDAGDIADYRYGLTAVGNFAALSGYLIAEGETDKINAILEESDFHDRVSFARHCVSNYSMSICDTAVPVANATDPFPKTHFRQVRAKKTRDKL